MEEEVYDFGFDYSQSLYCPYIKYVKDCDGDTIMLCTNEQRSCYYKQEKRDCDTDIIVLCYKP